MSKYAQMKDHEINAAVGESLGWHAKFIHQDDSVTFRDDLGRLRGRKNYCNSWADAGPIIEQNGICLIPLKKGWLTGINGVDVKHENPLRAAMIVFLMMHDKTEQEATRND